MVGIIGANGHQDEAASGEGKITMCIPKSLADNWVLPPYLVNDGRGEGL